MDNKKTWEERFDEKCFELSIHHKDLCCFDDAVAKESIKQFISEERKALIEEVKNIILKYYVCSDEQGNYPHGPSSNQLLDEILHKLELPNNK